MSEQELEKQLERDIVNANRAWHANFNDGPTHPDFLARELLAEGWRPLPTDTQLKEFLLGEGISEYSGDIHSWRCEHPERYGVCTCLDKMVEALLGMLNAGPKPRDSSTTNNEGA